MKKNSTLNCLCRVAFLVCMYMVNCFYKKLIFSSFLRIYTQNEVYQWKLIMNLFASTCVECLAVCCAGHPASMLQLFESLVCRSSH
jgi:hypothetical protein